MYKVAAIQMVSTENIPHNLERVANLIEEAVDHGAVLVALPENFAIMGLTEQSKLAAKEQLNKGPIQQFLQGQAEKHNIWISAGTIPLETKDPNRIYAASLLLNNHGEVVACYNKIHLFDVRLSADEVYLESNIIEPGHEIVVTDTPYGRLGLSVCYDVRFPELYRAMLEQGAEMVVVPSAFTTTTGRAHWEVLLRARAIENLCYVIAPNQGGHHSNGRETYGHSMIVDPWGKVVACSYQGEAVVVADINLARLNELRQSFPSIEHRKLL